MTLLGGRPLIFDFTCCNTVADSLVSKSCNEAGSAAEYAEEKKRRECNFDENFLFTPIGAETFGPWGSAATQFLKDLGGRIISETEILVLPRF